MSQLNAEYCRKTRGRRCNGLGGVRTVWAGYLDLECSLSVAVAAVMSQSVGAFVHVAGMETLPAGNTVLRVV